MSEEINKWYCYVCGKKVKSLSDFFLWTLENNTDRVFIACSQKCIDQLEDPNCVLHVATINEVKK